MKDGMKGIAVTDHGNMFGIKEMCIRDRNVGTPSYDGTFDFFEEWIERDVTDMVRRALRARQHLVVGWRTLPGRR